MKTYDEDKSDDHEPDNISSDALQSQSNLFENSNDLEHKNWL